MATTAPQSIELQRITMKANGAVTANRLVKIDTTEGQVLHTTGITEVAFGVAQETVADAAAVEVEVGSGAIVRMVASGAITAGDALMPAAAGGGKVSTLSGNTAVTCGQAIQGAADGATFTAIFRPGVRSPLAT